MLFPLFILHYYNLIVTSFFSWYVIFTDCNESCDPNANCTITDEDFLCVCDGETCIGESLSINLIAQYPLAICRYLYIYTLHTECNFFPKPQDLSIERFTSVIDRR